MLCSTQITYLCVELYWWHEIISLYVPAWKFDIFPNFVNCITNSAPGKKFTVNLFLLHRCLDKAAVVSDAESKSEEFSNPWRLCTVTQVEELKILIRMFPIWATGIVFSTVYAQMCTMFVEQGMMMDTSIGSFTIPAASLSSFDVISFIFWVPMYDRVIIPIARKFFGKERDCMTRFILWDLYYWKGLLCRNLYYKIYIMRLRDVHLQSWTVMLLVYFIIMLY